MYQKLEPTAPMAPAFEVVDLFDRPHYAAICTGWWFEHWGLFKPHSTLDTLIKDAKAASREGGLPRCWIAAENDQPIGSIILKENEHPDYPHLSPWIGDFYVHPRHRGKGVAYTLAAHAEHQARHNLGFDILYTQTPMPAFYAKLGWEGVEKIRDMSELETDDKMLMRKIL